MEIITNVCSGNYFGRYLIMSILSTILIVIVVMKINKLNKFVLEDKSKNEIKKEINNLKEYTIIGFVSACLLWYIFSSHLTTAIFSQCNCNIPENILEIFSALPNILHMPENFLNPRRFNAIVKNIESQKDM